MPVKAAEFYNSCLPFIDNYPVFFCNNLEIIKQFFQSFFAACNRVKIISIASVAFDTSDNFSVIVKTVRENYTYILRGLIADVNAFI